MKITLEQLKRLNACKDGIEWFKQVGSEDLAELVERAIKEKEFITSKGEKENTLDYAEWGISEIMSPIQREEWGIFSARQVEYLWKEKYPEKYAVWNKWASGEDKSEAARAAAWAAGAAGAAGAAVRAAGNAAGNAVWDAVAAGHAAGNAAWAAAKAAAKATAYNKMFAKILRYGVKILVGKDTPDKEAK